MFNQIPKEILITIVIFSACLFGIVLLALVAFKMTRVEDSINLNEISDIYKTRKRTKDVKPQDDRA